jgi:hypothetical protein
MESPNPERYGWQLASAVGLADVTCSMRTCSAPSVVAIQRVAKRHRRTEYSYWQGYCDEHGRSRGVHVEDGALAFTDDLAALLAVP